MTENPFVGSPFVGSWTYRSLLNDPALGNADNPDFNALKFGWGTMTLAASAPEQVTGTIGGDGWSLALRGAAGFGAPSQLRVLGKGVVGGEEWIYDYIGWLVPAWPNSTDALDRPAIVGSVVRTIPHSNGKGGTSPAGVVASFYAVRADAD